MWQLKQAVAFEQRKHVDHCNCFGCRGFYYVYLTFISFICWIVQFMIEICHLKCYINDNCSFAHLGDVKYYPKYKWYFPTDQTKFLELWNDIGLPYEERKQIYELIIPFISFDVNPNVMMVSINDRRKDDLITKVHDFAKAGNQCSLKDYKSLASHVN